MGKRGGIKVILYLVGAGKNIIPYQVICRVGNTIISCRGFLLEVKISPPDGFLLVEVKVSYPAEVSVGRGENIIHCRDFVGTVGENIVHCRAVFCRCEISIHCRGFVGRGSDIIFCGVCNAERSPCVLTKVCMDI